MSTNEAKKYAAIFPGQGSQSPGMLVDVHAAHPVVGQTFEEASDILGYDLWQLASEGPEEKQRQTQFTQPLMYCSGIALWRVWQSQTDQQPCVIAGHSLGEYCALTAAGCIDFSDALGLVNRRALLMADAVPDGEGGMAAILGMDDNAVVDLCQLIGEELAAANRVVEAVNFNAPGQVAISGHLDALEALVAVARDHGARKAIMLPVSVPNHSSLMVGAGKTLAAAMDDISWQAPTIPLMQNAGANVPASVELLLASLKEHVYSPVQWTRSVQQMVSDYSPELFIEFGPGKVLAGLGKRIDKAVPVSAVDSPETLQNTLSRLDVEMF